MFLNDFCNYRGLEGMYLQPPVIRFQVSVILVFGKSSVFGSGNDGSRDFVNLESGGVTASTVYS